MVRGSRMRMEWLNCEMKLKCLIYTACLIDSDLCRALFGREAGVRVEANWDDGDVRERERDSERWGQTRGWTGIKERPDWAQKKECWQGGVTQRTVWRQWQFCTFQSPQGLRNQGHNDLREEHDLFTGRQERGRQKYIKTREGEETRRGIALRGDKTRWSQMKNQWMRQEEIQEVRWQGDNEWWKMWKEDNLGDDIRGNKQGNTKMCGDKMRIGHWKQDKREQRLNKGTGTEELSLRWDPMIWDEDSRGENMRTAEVSRQEVRWQEGKSWEEMRWNMMMWGQKRWDKMRSNKEMRGIKRLGHRRYRREEEMG